MAFTIPIPECVISESVKTSLLCKMGNRGDGSDGVYDQQLLGIIGQNVLNLAIGKPYVKPSNKHDNGIDLVLFGKRFDVKTMTRSVAPELSFVNNFIASQSRFNVDGYIFTSINKTEMKISICGWIPKTDLEAKSELHLKGSIRTRRDGSSFAMKADTYEILNENLNYRFNSFPELFLQIQKWATCENTQEEFVF